MRILVVGSGGREHAITWALSRSAGGHELFVAPGNPGTESLASNVSIKADDIEGLVRFAKESGIELCVVGPEVPLVKGLADKLVAEGIPVVGPSAAAARLEGSKAFSKAFMSRHGIPTAAYRTFSSEEYESALAYVRAEGAPIVIKASGLAAGKGAVVCLTLSEAEETLDDMMRHEAFGSASDTVVVEAFMDGEEASIFALCDGADYVLLSPAQDHKRIGEGDTGLNTGGMGAYCPAPVMTSDLMRQACTEVIEPTLRGMAAEGAPYAGILYVGLMMTPQGPAVVEYNCRLGDPETQAVLMLLASDAADLFYAAATQALARFKVDLSSDAAACVVLASEGYPADYPRGRLITGIEEASRAGAVVFHAGTRHGAEGIETSGGRVLSVAATGHDLSAALETCYLAASKIQFEGMQYRRDIGQKGLARLESV
jgi:phosphoribosylamine---glycine ligase